MDSCHSGTGMDLPYVIKVGEDKMRCTGKVRTGGNGTDDDESNELTPQQKLMRHNSNKHFRESFTMISGGK